MRDLAQILDHWYAGRPVQAIAQSLAVDRKTVRKYIALAQEAGFQPGAGTPPPEGWPAWLALRGTALTARPRPAPTAAPIEALKPLILEWLHAQVPPTTIWRRLRNEQRL